MSGDQGYSQQQMFEMLTESQYWSRAQMQEYQRSQLEQMLRHAKANVPFYKTRLDCMFRRDGSINWDRWEEIPILTKEELRDNFEALQATEIPASHGQVHVTTTSGTASFPISVLHSELEGDIWQCLRWRAQTWWQLDWSSNLMYWNTPGRDDDVTAGATAYGPWAPPWAIGNGKAGQEYYMPRNLPLARRLTALKELDIDILHGRVHLAFVAALAMEVDKTLPRVSLKSILGYGSAVESQYEDICRTQFGAQIHSSFATTECGRIAYSCQDNNTYHISEECVFCEIVNPAGMAVSGSSYGNLIITPFLCSAMPLIRYAQGDLGKWKDNCSCGLTLRSLAKVNGRIAHMFDLPDGKILAANVPEWMRTTLNILSWQFAQVGKDLVEVRYMRRTPLSEREEEWLAGGLDSYFSQVFAFTFVVVTELREEKSGKFIQYVNEYRPKV